MRVKSKKITHVEIVSAVVKIWTLMIGTVFVLIGIFGMIAPVIPGIPFLLFGLSLYAKSIQSFNEWLERKELKPYLNFIFFIKTIYGYLFGLIKKLAGRLKFPDRVL
jgi:hypothetical protein